MYLFWIINDGFCCLEKVRWSSSIPEKWKASACRREGNAGDQLQHLADQVAVRKPTCIPPYRRENDKC